MTIRKTKKADIKTNSKDSLRDEDFDSKNIRHRISIVIPEDILEYYRNLAKEKGLGYQTLMNQALRDAASSNVDTSLINRIERLEKLVLPAGTRKRD